MSYLPRTVPEGTLAEPYMLAPGVLGAATEREGRVYIHYVEATSEGDGAVGRFLDRLDPKCAFTEVIGSRLRGMLQRRGWKKRLEDDGFGDKYEVWTKQ